MACSHDRTSGNAGLPDPSVWLPTGLRSRRRYRVGRCMVRKWPSPRWPALLVEWQPVQHRAGRVGSPDASPIALPAPYAVASTASARRAWCARRSCFDSARRALQRAASRVRASISAVAVATVAVAADQNFGAATRTRAPEESGRFSPHRPPLANRGVLDGLVRECNTAAAPVIDTV